MFDILIPGIEADRARHCLTYTTCDCNPIYTTFDSFQHLTRPQPAAIFTHIRPARSCPAQSLRRVWHDRTSGLSKTKMSLSADEDDDDNTTSSFCIRRLRHLAANPKEFRTVLLERFEGPPASRFRQPYRGPQAKAHTITIFAHTAETLDVYDLYRLQKALKSEEQEPLPLWMREKVDEVVAGPALSCLGRELGLPSERLRQDGAGVECRACDTLSIPAMASALTEGSHEPSLKKVKGENCAMEEDVLWQAPPFLEVKTASDAW